MGQFLVELVIEVQERFGARFGHEELRKVETFGDLADLILMTQR
jgi:acyl carrier protein